MAEMRQSVDDFPNPNIPVLSLPWGQYDSSRYISLTDPAWNFSAGHPMASC